MGRSVAFSLHAWRRKTTAGFCISKSLSLSAFNTVNTVVKYITVASPWTWGYRSISSHLSAFTCPDLVIFIEEYLVTNTQMIYKSIWMGLWERLYAIRETKLLPPMWKLEGWRTCWWITSYYEKIESVQADWDGVAAWRSTIWISIFPPGFRRRRNK